MSIFASAPSVLSISHYYAEAWVGLRVKPSFSNGVVTEILRCTPASVFSEIRAFFRFFRKAPFLPSLIIHIFAIDTP
ncbi:MAG: hypothetical protein CRN43_16005 [Candidatus Nephrothrix sp. EaCA]|nr:MAG: hypothetical protein CRN43_16005 [Candidatus Nephrothrix sp. EaCA]